MAVQSSRWQIVAPTSLIRRNWPDEDEWALFNAASGDLHLLNHEAMAVLDVLCDGPACPESICASVGATDLASVVAALDALDALGLASPVPL